MTLKVFVLSVYVYIFVVAHYTYVGADACLCLYVGCYGMLRNLRNSPIMHAGSYVVM